MSQKTFACALMLAGMAVIISAAVASSMPHFRWGQTKDTIFLSVMVRDLDPESVSVALLDGVVHFSARNQKGEKHMLELPLREDVDESFKHEIAERTDRWGIVVLIALTKVNKHRWDQLVENPKKFKGLIDKDWSREDQKLDADEELPYMEDNSDFLVSITQKNLNKTLSKYSTTVMNVRYPWCSECRSLDDTFAKAARNASKSKKKDARWKTIAFAVLDAREEWRLAKRFGAKCEPKMACEYQVFTESAAAPVPLKAKWSESDLLAAVSNFFSPSVQTIKSDEEFASLKGKNTTCVGSFASEDSPGYAVLKRVANILRGELVFAARFGEDKPLELWQFGQESAYEFDGALEDDGTAVVRWIRPRIIPVLQEYTWHFRETYEALDLPMAKVWFDDANKNPSFDDVWSDAVRQVAKRFVGKIAFVMQKKSAHDWELRDYGMTNPESFPVFGIAANASQSSIKYGFEVTPDVASSAPEFWKDTDKVVERLSLFCEDFLAGKVPEAHESTSRQTNWTEGHVKRIVWNAFAEIESPERPLLLSLFSRYRPENDRMLKEIESLAMASKPHAGLFTVASYVTSDNHLPSGAFNHRDRYSPDTEWWWVPAVSADGKRKQAPKKLMKPKNNAPIKTVVSFALKKAGIPSINADDIMARFEALMEENVSTTVQALEPPGANLSEEAGVLEQKDELAGSQEL